MERRNITDKFSLSAIAHGFWRADQWPYNKKELYELITELISHGITTFDHADIYGGGEAERIFGEVLKGHPELRSQIEIVTKCGIVRNPENLTAITPSYYDTSYNHIIQSVNNSLKRLNTDYVDLLLIHRVDHLMDYREVAKAFSDLRRAGKVRYFGVSNFLEPQLSALNKFYPEIVLNQIQVSVDHLEHFQNGTLEKLQEAGMKTMAYSPLGGGHLLKHPTYRPDLRAVLERIQKEVDAPSLEALMIAWVMKHPLKMIPIMGSHKKERILKAVDALEIELSNRQFYEIYTVSQQARLP